MVTAATDLFGMADTSSSSSSSAIYVACVRTSHSTVFDQLEIGLTWAKLGAKKRAIFYPVGKKNG